MLGHLYLLEMLPSPASFCSLPPRFKDGAVIHSVTASLVLTVKDFFSTGLLPPALNKTIIILIPLIEPSWASRRGDFLSTPLPCGLLFLKAYIIIPRISGMPIRDSDLPGVGRVYSWPDDDCIHSLAAVEGAEPLRFST